jgi:hypothetical protein
MGEGPRIQLRTCWFGEEEESNALAWDGVFMTADGCGIRGKRMV